MPHSQLVSSHPISHEDLLDEDKPGLLLAVLLVILPFALIYASDVQAFV